MISSWKDVGRDKSDRVSEYAGVRVMSRYGVDIYVIGSTGVVAMPDGRLVIAHVDWSVVRSR